MYRQCPNRYSEQEIYFTSTTARTATTTWDILMTQRSLKTTWSVPMTRYLTTTAPEIFIDKDKVIEKVREYFPETWLWDIYEAE